MNPIWQTHLRNYHANIKNNCVMLFGNITTERKITQTETIMTDLSHFGLIRFAGEDAQTFLQSQLSCDLRDVNPQKAQHGSYCNPKGRVLTTFLLWQHGNDYLMQLPISLAASIQKRLTLYVLRSKVQLTDPSNNLVRIGLAGQNIAKLAEKITGLSCDQNQSLCSMHNEKVNVLCQAPNQMQLIASIEDAPQLWEQFIHYAKPVGGDCWNWLNIQSGIPVILPETQEAFLPQMINLDTIGGISFKKGCYPGQEIVARTQYLGKLKRRMFQAHIATSKAVKAGDSLYSADMEDQSSGNIVNAARSPVGGFDVLAVIQQSSMKTNTIHWQSLQGPILKIKLPSAAFPD
jgi:folate-binding protein YgfZ